MPEVLPYTQVFAGSVPATEIYHAENSWPAPAVAGPHDVHVTYDHRALYNQPITYDGRVLSTDATLVVGVTRRRTPKLGLTRVSPPVGETRNDTLEVAPTRPGRRIERALATRVIRYTMLSVAPTRGAKDVGMTRRGATIGPTRVRRGK